MHLLPEATHPLPTFLVLRVVKPGPELPLERSVAGAAPGSPPPLAALSPAARPREQQALSHDAPVPTTATGWGYSCLPTPGHWP